MLGARVHRRVVAREPLVHRLAESREGALDRPVEALVGLRLPLRELGRERVEPHALTRRERHALLGEPREMHLEVAALPARAGEPAQAVGHARADARPQPAAVRAHHAAEPAQRDAEVVQALGVLGMAQPHPRLEQVVEPLERDEPGAARRGQIEQVRREGHAATARSARSWRGVERPEEHAAAAGGRALELHRERGALLEVDERPRVAR